jgi:hypothetical protein
LPQLLNVAFGEMSLVGPRPERPEICEDLARHIGGYYDRNAVKPGVTGLAQINLPPDETVDDVRRKQILDMHYIAEANWWLDLRMLVATALRMIGIKGELVMKWMGLCRRDLLHQWEWEHCLPHRACNQDENLGAWADSTAEKVSDAPVWASSLQSSNRLAVTIKRPR